MCTSKGDGSKFEGFVITVERVVNLEVVVTFDDSGTIAGGLCRCFISRSVQIQIYKSAIKE